SSILLILWIQLRLFGGIASSHLSFSASGSEDFLFCYRLPLLAVQSDHQLVPLLQGGGEFWY
ncbi:hypothetical protein AMATHDRAFT_164067, partial [Amanita thiersii Skay4041]